MSLMTLSMKSRCQFQPKQVHTYIHTMGSDTPVECMLVMSEDNPGVWEPLGFGKIEGFTYERGHEYYLSVRRTILANPPADASDRTYSLIRILEDRVVTEPEVPVDEEITSEEDIEYHDLCPFEKYAISKEFVVDKDGNIYYGDGSSLPSYDNARIWLEDVLDKEDPNWVKFQTVLEKPRDFDPFGQAGLSPLATI